MKFTDTRFGLDTEVEAHFERYGSGEIAIQLFEVDTGEPWARATVSVGTVIPGCIAVKDYSENAGMSQLLARVGIIEGNPVQRIASGFVSIPVYQLTPAALELAQAA